MQHLIFAQKHILIFNTLQMYIYKKLMQAQKMACRSGKNVVILQSQLRIKKQEPRIRTNLL